MWREEDVMGDRQRWRDLSSVGRWAGEMEVGGRDRRIKVTRRGVDI